MDNGVLTMGKQLIARGGQGLGITRHNGDPCPFVDEALGTGKTNAFAAASDQDMLVVQFQIHHTTS